jgi:hypothetical protein
MKSASYSMTRRTHKYRKEDNVENMEAQSTSTEKPGHLQKWMKKTEQPRQNGSHEASSSLTFSEAYTGSCGRSHIYTQVIYRKVAYIHELTEEQVAYLWEKPQKERCTYEL